MPGIVWDKIGSRVYESGLDRGVLYLPDGRAIPWNGLTSVVENSQTTAQQVFFDGMLVNELVLPGSYKAVMKAITYPKEFEHMEGTSYDARGVYYNNQPPTIFNFTYRTLASNDLDEDAGYKIHLIYNVMALPSDKTYASIGEDPSLVEFEWNLTGIPEEIPGHRPTAHITIDSRKTDPGLLAGIEEILYGSDAAFANLPSLPEFVAFMTGWYRIKIIDNGDGTWTALSDIPGLVVDNGDGTFQINEIDAVYLDPETYRISTTASAADVPLIAIDLFANGVWTATSESDALIQVNPDGTFSIFNIEAEFAGDDMYRITDTF